MKLFFILIFETFLFLVSGQTAEMPNFMCHENDIDVTFAFSLSAHSAQDSSSNCLLLPCDIPSNDKSNCHSSPFVFCYDYRTINNIHYCAPGILCSLLTPCNDRTHGCEYNSSVCVINSCCSPQAVYLPLIFTSFCMPTNETMNSNWSYAGPLNTARTLHTASVLANNSVLVAGGTSGSTSVVAFAHAEVYNSTTKIWTVTNSMNVARYAHTSSVLLDGNVLVTGGFNNGDFINSTELYNFSTRTWSSSGLMNVGRCYHTASVLLNGSVLVAGGLGIHTPFLSTTELYDPTTKVWTATSHMNHPRYSHTATVLLDGKVLVAGGDLNFLDRNSELYDPVTENWTFSGSMTDSRAFHTASLLLNGMVLVTGGLSQIIILNTAELYDPLTGMWTPVRRMHYARSMHTATVLVNGEVLIVGGMDSNRLITVNELYDPLTDTWTIMDSLGTGRASHTASRLSNGQVLIAGGSGFSGALNSAELYS